MTAVTPKKRAVKRVSRNQPPVPETADRLTIAGKDYVLIPWDAYADWYEDHMLGIIAEKNLKDERRLAVPFEEAVARIRAARKKKS